MSGADFVTSTYDVSLRNLVRKPVLYDDHLPGQHPFLDRQVFPSTAAVEKGDGVFLGEVG